MAKAISNKVVNGIWDLCIYLLIYFLQVYTHFRKRKLVMIWAKIKIIKISTSVHGCNVIIIYTIEQFTHIKNWWLTTTTTITIVKSHIKRRLQELKILFFPVTLANRYDHAIIKKKIQRCTISSKW